MAYLFSEENNTEIEEMEPVAVEELKSDNDRAVIVIESDVAGAEVYLNSVYQGKTKLNIKNLLPAQYILQIQKNGKESKKYFVAARKGYSLIYRILFWEEDNPEEK